MAFTVPVFNLAVNIFTGPWPGVLRISPMGNLAFGRRVPLAQDGFGFSIPVEGGTPMSLLLPAGTDVRDRSCSTVSDYVEAPAGSGRWYIVGFVDDIGKGFSNEHRIAYLWKVFDGVAGAGTYPGLMWPVPIP